MKTFSLTTAFILIALSCLSAQSAAAQDKPSAKVAKLFEESGYSYTKAKENVWTVAFRGGAFSSFNLVASVSQDILVIFVIVAEKKDVKVTPELMRNLLKLNSDLDRVKIGIDNDGDIFVRVDLSIRILDLQEFKANIEQVAASADEVYKAIKPFI
jgi:hypothetical protein